MVLLFASLPLHAAERAAVIATYAYARYDRAAALQPLATVLGEALGQAVQVRVLESPRALAAALREGSVDLAVTNTFVYLAVRGDAHLQPLAVFDVPAATLDAYRGVLLARRDRVTLTTLRLIDRPLRYAQVIPGSTSGGLVQDLFLAASGVNGSTQLHARYSGTHEAALADLQQDRADVAALADAPWQAAQRASTAGDVVELWRSPPIPPGPMVCRDAGRIDCAQARALLLNLQHKAPDALAAVVAAWSEAAGATRLVPVREPAYDALTAGFADAAAGRAVLEKLL
jgi:ABC-type phosphate/phosphonate transport system substrate-binding protein